MTVTTLKEDVEIESNEFKELSLVLMDKMQSVVTSLFNSSLSKSSKSQVGLTEGFYKPSVAKNLALYRTNDYSDSTPMDGNMTYNKCADSSKLHVLLVTETWLPDVNGVAMSLHQLMNQLVLLGHKVSLISPETSVDSTELKTACESNTNDTVNTSSLKANSATVHDIRNNDSDTIETEAKHLHSVSIAPNDILTHKVEVKGWAIPRYSELQFGMPDYPLIRKTIQDIQPDIVHIATEGPLGLATLIAAKRQSIPATTGYHTQFHDFSRHFGMGIIARPLMAYFKWFHNTSKATCVPSPKTQSDLDKLGFKRLYQVGRGVDLELFNPAHRCEKLRQQWGTQGQFTVLTMVSRLSPEKNVDTVIESFKKLQGAQLHRALKLVIVGDGPDRSRLEALASNCGDDIIFTGAKKGYDLARHYASGDVFVFASEVETFGNVVTEAMASGLPVYAYDDAAAGMLVTEDSGRLAQVGAKADFINMVATLPKMQVLKKQGKHARNQVAGFSWQRPAKQMLAMFEQVIDSQHT